MNVMTQDNSRQFLSNSTPKDKYKFFLQGTQLEQLDKDYQRAEMAHDSRKIMLAKQEDQLDVMKQKWLAAQSKCRSIKNQQILRTKLAKIEGQIAWMHVYDEEAKLDTLQQHIDEIQNEIAGQQQRYEDAKSHKKILQVSQTSVQPKIDEAQTTYDSLQSQYEQIKETFDGNAKDLKELVTQQRTLKSKVESNQANIERFKNELSKINNANELRGGSRPAELQRCIAEFQQAHTDLLEQRRSTDAELLMANEKYRATNLRLEAMRQTCDEAKQKLKAAQENLTRIAHGGGREKLLREARPLLTDIAREKRFKVQPIGPLWQHVKLLEQKWSPILESVLGFCLEGFIVSCKADMDLLNEILAKHRV